MPSSFRRATPLQVIDAATASRLAETFGALSDPTRLRIISALAHHELSVGALATTVGLSESATSHQLRVLRTLRLVRARRDGRRSFYCLADDHIHDLFDRALEHAKHD